MGKMNIFLINVRKLGQLPKTSTVPLTAESEKLSRPSQSEFFPHTMHECRSFLALRRPELFCVRFVVVGMVSVLLVRV